MFLPFISLMLSLFAFTHAQGPPKAVHDCNTLFSKDGIPSPAPKDSTLKHCAIDSNAPTSIGSTSTHIYHFDRHAGWKDDTDHTAQLEIVRQGLNDSIIEYSKFAILPEIYVFIVREDWNTEFGATAEIAAPGEACRVRLLWHAMVKTSAAYTKQNIAHELWHCVQFQHFGPDALKPAPGITHAAHNWWLEGSAEFFSNHVYPPTNLEWQRSRSYDANKPLHSQSYAASVFFQYLWVYNGDVSPVKIWEWMKSFSITWDATSEASRVASLPDMATWFPAFIEAMEGEGVVDSDQVSFVPKDVAMKTDLFKTSLSKDSPTAEHTIKVDSFTGNYSVTMIKEGQTVGLSYSGDPAVMLKYKVQHYSLPEQVWAEVPSDGEITIDVPCGRNYVLQLLTTNVAATEKSIDVKITRKEKTKCACKTPESLGKSPLAKRYINGDSRFASDHKVATVGEIDPTTGLNVPADDEEDDDLPECEDDPVDLDKCLVGSWSLNLENMEELLKVALVIPDVPELQISNVDLTGSSVMSISDSWVGNWTWDAVNMAFDITTLDIRQHTKTLINGDMSFNVVGMSESTSGGGVIVKSQDNSTEEGAFTMDVLSASGSVVGYSDLVGEITWPMDNSYVPPDLVLKYVCTESTLALTGFAGDGAQAGWVYAFDRV